MSEGWAMFVVCGGIFLLTLTGFFSYGSGFDAGKRAVTTDSGMRLKLAEIRHILDDVE